MSLEMPSAIALSRLLLACGLALQSVESLANRRIFATGGPWGSDLADELPQERTRARPIGVGGMTWLFGVRLVICVWLAAGPVDAFPWLDALLQLALLATSALLVVRMRGPLCGGSDSMFFQVQLGLFTASLGFLHPGLARIGLGWIAAQSVLSYFLAGLAKARNAGWWNGAALRSLFASKGPYVILGSARELARKPVLCAVLGWAIVGFELGFPVIMALPFAVKGAFLGLGLLFHLANAAVLGLNRFIWAWVATYPALLYF